MRSTTQVLYLINYQPTNQPINQPIQKVFIFNSVQGDPRVATMGP